MFGHAAGQQYSDFLLHPLLGLVAHIFLRQSQGKAARPAAGNDGNLMHLILLGAVVGDDGVAGLVVSGQAALLIGDDMAALFGANGDLQGGLLDILHGDGLAILAGGQQRSLIGQVFEIGAGKATGKAGDHGKVHIRANGFIAGMDAKDRLAALHIGIIDGDMAVKAAGTQQSGVQDILAVGGRHNDNA